MSIDGVEHFCSESVHCPHCLKRKHRDAQVGYHHAMLSAVLVHPEQQEVFVMVNEPIIGQDGQKENDCKRNAAKQLLEGLQAGYGKEWLVFVMDALYSCGPIIRQIIQNQKWQYLIGVKPDGNKSLFAQFEGCDQRGQVKWVEWAKNGSTHRFSYTNGLALNSSNSDLWVNMLYYQQLHANKKKQVFSWVTGMA